jgi:pectinesterase
VTIQAGIPASQAGSNDASGTLRIHKDNFKMYNVNVKNTYGKGSQAIAISQYGSKVGLYACGFYGFQDTLYANQGTQVYLRGYIEVSTVEGKIRLGAYWFYREQPILSLDVRDLHSSARIPSQ